ncbi:MAG: ribulokinase [Alistipes sp.]|nr:ribulokinase [Alistipes sp.]
MNSRKYVIGIDFGTDSVRALIVATDNGDEIASGVSAYKRWSKGLYCNPKLNQYRQHPLDYIESLSEAIHSALCKCDSSVANGVVGLSFDCTASTPCLINSAGTPLALLDKYSENPDAMFILWKDHTAIAESDKINDVAKRWHTDYTKYGGGNHSCEWVWAKMLHSLRVAPELQTDAYSWVEHCDWISALLAGDTTPERILRSRCAAGHKAMWHAEWGGLPEKEFLHEVDPLLDIFDGHLFSESYTSNVSAGRLCPQWAERLGLKEGIAVGVGSIDCHVGAVGAGVRDGVLVKVMGTSTCDITTAAYEVIGEHTVRGICGQVDGSVLPGRIGFEAGQAAFGDIYAWYKRLLGWSLRCIADIPDLEDRILGELTRQAEQIPVTADDMIAVDWFNGRRSPDDDPLATGQLTNLTLATTAPEIFKALVEATAFGSRAINERLADEGLRIDTILAVGGISKKSRFVMQTMADVIGVNIRVVRSEQACALGSAMNAAVASGVYPSVEVAQDAMSSGFEAEYIPNAERHEVYNKLYARYLAIAYRK